MMPAAAHRTELPMTLMLGGGPTVGRLGFGAMRITGAASGVPLPTRAKRSHCFGELSRKE